MTVKHDSSRDRDNYTFHPTRQFSLIWDTDPGDCTILFLDERQCAVLRRMCATFPKYHWVWGLPSPRREWDNDTVQLWADISDFVEDLEGILMGGCNVDDLVSVLRTTNAILAGESLDLSDPIPQTVDYSLDGIVPTLEKYLIHLEALGEIPGSGDTIQTSLQHLVEASGWTADTVDDLLAGIAALDPGALDTFSDLANLLIAYKSLFPGTTNVHVVKSFYSSWVEKRYWHNHLSIQAHQATALNGIMRALAPFEDDDAEEYGSLVQKLFSVPWLAKSLVAVLEPGPVGETLLAAETLTDVGIGIASIIKTAWFAWWDKWVNRIAVPAPVDTITGNLSAIADAIASIQPEDQGDIDGASVAVALDALSTALGVNNQALVDALSGLDLVSNVTCGSCSGVCTCGGGLPSQPAIEGATPPAGWDTPVDDMDNPIGSGNPDYQARKCSVSNILHFQVVAIVQGVNDSPTMGAIIGLTEAVVGELVLIALGAIIGELATPIPYFDSVIGIAVALIVIGLDLGNLLITLDDYEDELICALYNSTSTTDAIENYLAVLSDAGEGLANIGLVGAILTYDMVNMVFFQNSSLSQAIEDAIENYAPPNPCTSCCSLNVAYGQLDSDDGATAIFTALNQDNAYRVQLDFCSPAAPTEISALAVLSGSVTHPTGISSDAWRLWYYQENPTSESADYESDIIPPTPVFNVYTISIASDTVFTVQIDYNLG